MSNLFNELSNRWDDCWVRIGDLNGDKRNACMREIDGLFHIMKDLGMLERLCEEDEDDSDWIADELLHCYYNLEEEKK